MLTSRRDFVRFCSMGALALASSPTVFCRGVGVLRVAGPTAPKIILDEDWLFGGKFAEGSDEPGFDDGKFDRVQIPHCVAKLSWQNWSPAQWADRWIYRRHFRLPPELMSQRVFLNFDGVMTGAAPRINGHSLPSHAGGYLPFGYEITRDVAAENLLALVVDGRWQSVPPEGSPRGPSAVDYLEPAGIHRPVSLRVVPQTFIRDVFAKPVKVLDSERRVDVLCTLDAAIPPAQPVRVRAHLMNRGRVVAAADRELRIEKAGDTEVPLTISRLGNISFWEPDSPELYDVVVTLYENDRPSHDYCVRIGFREARFEVDGFFLNGRRFQIFGLDRHEIYPYVGAAMPRRVMRRDAEILRHDFNCNFVRCSHYPQSEAFIEACDELGLMVWEEMPGWQYIGDEAWKDLAVRDVRDMVRRDRNHPSVVIWGVRVNESPNNPALYSRTKAAAKELDDSRPTSGAMNRYSTKDWNQDVYAYDDYHSAPDGSVGVRDPLPGVPYFLTEAVGQFAYGPGKGGFGRKYRRAGEIAVQQQQAIWHAQVHDRAQKNSRMGGVIAWCAFDYASLINPHNAVKCPGVADVFRIPKLGAAFYQSQGDPEKRAIIQPDFYWDFGPQSPDGPGERAAIFSNCDRLEIRINGKLHTSCLPDREEYPHLKHPPFFANLTVDGSARPELRIDGFLRDKKVLSRSFSSDPAGDRLLLKADDSELFADGTDATRLIFRAVDKYGVPRPFVKGEVAFTITGPGVIIGDNPFRWEESGGAGAVWIRTVRGKSGKIKVTASSPLGKKSVTIAVHPVRA